MDILQFLEYLIAAHMVRERVQNNSASDSGKIDDQIINGVAQDKGNRIARLKSNFCKIPTAAVHKVVKFLICPPIITLNKKSLGG
jgi:hypothetical protein